MTNKPMLSVERELLERFVSDVEAHNYGFDGLEELRAILDKPAECRCKRYGKDNPHWPCPVHAKPAVQHQGEPVVWVECSPAWLKAGGDCATAPRICVGREGISHLHSAHSNAEQPAPVAVADHKAELADKLESLAETIYNSWDSQPGWVPWKDGMHGSKQNEARQIASRTFELALSGHAAEASKE